MTSRFLLGLLAMLSVSVVFCDTAEAQAYRRGTNRVPHYQRTQTISPYVQLFRPNNGGGVTNYFLDVRPRLQYQQELNRLEQTGYQQAQYQQQMLMQQTQGINQMLANPNGQLLQFTTRGGQGARAAAAGSFMNTARFFPPSTFPGQQQVR
jgi:hypothetical protein